MGRFTPAYFDTMEWDYFYWDIVSPVFAGELDGSDQLFSHKSERVTLTSIDPTRDSMGGKTATTETSDTNVDVVLFDIETSARMLAGRGVVKTGVALMFGKRKYDLTNNGNAYTIKVGDKITRTYNNDEVWRVEKSTKHYAEGGVVYVEYEMVKEGT